MPLLLEPAPELKIYSTTNGNTVAYKKPNDQGAQVWDGFDVNDSAVLLLQHLQECQQASTFVSSFCTKHRLDEAKARDWIERFVLQMVERKAITVSESAGRRKALAVEIPVLKSAKASLPRSVIVEITNTCNEACAHCYLAAGPKRLAKMDLAAFTSLCQQMRKAHVYRMQLTGGEVFMHPKFPEMLEVALAEFSEVAVFTNATILTERVLELLVAHRERITLSISLDSANPETHNRLRNHRRAYEKTVANIRRLTNAGIFVRISAVLFDENMWELEAMAQQAHELGAKMFVFNFIEGFGRGKDMVEQQAGQGGQEYLDYLAEVVEKYKHILPIVEEEQRSEIAVRDNCGAGSNSVVVSANGDLRPCNLFPESFSFGNVHRDSWEDLFAQPMALKLRDTPAPSEETGCPPECEHLTYCRGCLLHALNVNAVDRAENYCAWVRDNRTEALVTLFAKSV